MNISLYKWSIHNVDTFFATLLHRAVLPDIVNTNKFLYTYGLCIDLLSQNKPYIKNKNINKIQNMIHLFTLDDFSIDLKCFMICYFFKIQRYLFLMKRCVRRFKFKKTTIFDNNLDFYQHSLDENKKFVINLKCDTMIFKFRIHDLIKLIIENLTTTLDHYSLVLINNPLIAKNPYTNTTFKLNELYNIYFFAKSKQISIPLFFEELFKCQFCVHTFLLNNEAQLRDYTITHFNNNFDLNVKYRMTCEMFHKFGKLYDENASVSDKTKTVEKYKDQLIHYLHSEYSYLPAKKEIHTKFIQDYYMNDSSWLFSRRLPALRRRRRNAITPSLSSSSGSILNLLERTESLLLENTETPNTNSETTIEPSQTDPILNNSTNVLVDMGEVYPRTDNNVNEHNIFDTLFNDDDTEGTENDYHQLIDQENSTDLEEMDL
jgi:hypothetical protein